MSFTSIGSFNSGLWKGGVSNIISGLNITYLYTEAYFKWNPISNANSYIISIPGKMYITQNNFQLFTGLTDGNTYTFSINAVINGFNGPITNGNITTYKLPTYNTNNNTTISSSNGVDSVWTFTNSPDITNPYIVYNFEPSDINNPSIYYSFNLNDVSGYNLADFASGYPVYNASLSQTSIVSATNPKFGTASLSLSSANSQFVKINKDITTNNTGSSFSFWMKNNSANFYSTLFNFGNGQGQDNITMGIYNNTLYNQVVAGNYTNSTITFSNSIQFSTLPENCNWTCVTVSNDGNTIVVGNYQSYKLWFSKYNGSSWSSYSNFATTSSGIYRICFNYNATRGVVICLNACYMITWNTNTYSISLITDGQTNPTYYGGALSLDGNMLVVANSGSGKILYSTWDAVGNKYNTFNTTLETANNPYIGVAISNDKSKIVYSVWSTSSPVYIAYWNGTNFSAGTTIVTGLKYPANIIFSPDANVIYLSQYSNTSSSLWYSYWNGSNYSSFIGVSTSAMPLEANWSLSMVNNDIYGIGYADSGIVNIVYKTTVSISNVSTMTNFTNTNLNDNTWHHIVWVLQPNGSYQYYIDNTIVYTVSGKTYPSVISRTTNYIGKSSDLSMSYYDGVIDDFRFYNRVLTSSEISTLYNFNGIKAIPVRLANLSNSSSPVYNATVSSASIVSTSNPIAGNGSLVLTNSGDYVSIDSITTTNSGLSFSFWLNSNNPTCAYYPVFDFGTGGGNNNISFFVYNNLVGSKIEDISNSVATISNLVDVSNQVPSILNGGTYFCVISSNNRFAAFRLYGYTDNYITSGNLYGSYSSYNLSNIISGVVITADGSKIVVSTYSNIYFSIWDNSFNSFNTFTSVNVSSIPNVTNSLGLYSASPIVMSDNGNIIMVYANTYFYYSFWNGTNYGPFTACSFTFSPILIGLSRDGTRFFYFYFSKYTGLAGATFALSLWNGTTFSTPTTLSPNGYHSDSNIPYPITFSYDDNFLFFSTFTAGYLTISVYKWNGSTYNYISTPAYADNGNYPVVYMNNDLTTILITSQGTGTKQATLSITNYTSNKSFYNTNVNDGVSRHYAWTIDASGTYNYYVNGSLISTTTGGLSYPLTKTLTNNYIGLSNDVSGNFVGKIDNFRIYNRVLSQAEITSIYRIIPCNSGSIDFNIFNDICLNIIAVGAGSPSVSNSNTSTYITGGGGGQVIYTPYRVYDYYSQSPNITTPYNLSITVGNSSTQSQITLSSNSSFYNLSNISDPFFNGVNPSNGTNGNSTLYNDVITVYGGNDSSNAGGGGAGTFGNGYSASPNIGGNGGPGIGLTINNVLYGPYGGGGGGYGSSQSGVGGIGGGGNGGINGNGLANTGGGAGGSNSTTIQNQGGSGVVVIVGTTSILPSVVSGLSYGNIVGNATTNTYSVDISYNQSFNNVIGYCVQFSGNVKNTTTGLTANTFVFNLPTTLVNNYSGLNGGNTYTISAYTVGTYGNSLSAKIVIPQYTLPPTNLTGNFAGTTANSISFSFTAPTPMATTYNITAIDVSNSASIFYANNISGSLTTANVSGLVSGNIYNISMVSINTYGISLPSNKLMYGTAPNPPTNLSITANTANSISISFTQPSMPITNYYVTANTIGNTFSAPASTYTIYGLKALTQYNINLIASNNYGNSILSSTLIGSTTNYASGGVITYSGGYTIHTFTTSGTFTIYSGGTGGITSIDIFLVGGGGSGNFFGGGGGEAKLTSNYAINNAGSFTITIGSGGAINNNTGGNSGKITTIKDNNNNTTITANYGTNNGVSGNNNRPNNTVSANGNLYYSGGGGAGGAPVIATSANNYNCNGGAGSQCAFNNTYYGGGGAGSGVNSNQIIASYSGGMGGGGNTSSNGGNNTGGGGGALPTRSTAGGSGIAIIRYSVI